ncbi:hypothetical protein B0T13DRAFT_508431 [Neurospora crassa]|nr:hypothetical protein B0T13DRAFT_508431 [Neurospora crassa]
MSEITKQYESDIREYARDSDPEVAKAGRMGESLLWKTSGKMKRLADAVEYGGTVDIPKAKEDLEAEISRAS